MAGIAPRKVQLNGQDLVAYILSSNDRRDMTQGQRAIVAALCHNLLQRGEPAELARSLKVPRQIARHTPDLAEQMRAVSATGHRPGKRALAPLAQRDDRDIRRPRNQLQWLAAQQPTNQSQLALNGKPGPIIIILHGNTPDEVRFTGDHLLNSSPQVQTPRRTAALHKRVERKGARNRRAKRAELGSALYFGPP
jgi:hypothetical protein